MEKETKCPYCGSPNVEWIGNEYEPNDYHCHECDCWFSLEDCEREDIRHKISTILNGTSEEKPLKIDIIIGDSYSCGLSSLEMPNVISAFEMEGDGTIWFKIDGESDWRNFDDFVTDDLRIILKDIVEFI